jgi:Ca2+-binding EF-hand superfamily protein
VQRLANGQLTVKELVRTIAKSQEYNQRFGQTEPGEGQPYERAVARLYRHVLGRQPDASGQRSWASAAQQRGFASIIDGFVDSAEYTNNFGDWAVPGSGGVRFCEGNQNQSNTSSSAQPLDNRRFRGMDANRDGVISRNEWNGSAQSFRTHDWNRDGVLSGDEVDAARFRQGRNADFEDFDRAEEFEFLDTNNNNRIEEREWHASIRAFDQLDRNNDGFLSRPEFVRPNNAGTAATSGQVIAVGGDREWVDTGITLTAGDTVTISADGQIRLSRENRTGISAAGAGNRIPDATIPSAPVGGLVARFGNSAPVFIGQNRTMRVPRSGRLFLGVNDSYFDDNTGQFNVRVDTD